MPLVTFTDGARVRTHDARWREAFDVADSVSEGAVRLEEEKQPNGGPGRRRVWYGSTSLILSVEASSDEERAFLAAVAERDLHVRTRAIRLAVREAAVRAAAQGFELSPGSPHDSPQRRVAARLGRSQCEMRFAVDPRGVRIDVDVQAPLIEASASAHRRGASSRR